MGRDYTGGVIVLLTNYGDVDRQVEFGVGIDQIIVKRTSNDEIVEVENLNKTNGVSGVFGSIGCVVMTGIDHETLGQLQIAESIKPPLSMYIDLVTSIKEPTIRKKHEF